MSQGLQARREEFFRGFPNAEALDGALRTPANPTPMFFLARDMQNPDLKEVGFAIGRLGEEIERAFAINGEVAFFFAPWRDFQRRSFNVMTEGLQEYARKAQGRTTNEGRYRPSRQAAILVCPDPQVSSKVSEWQSDSLSPTILVPVDLTGVATPDAVRAQLRRCLKAALGDRDLYRQQNPVTGQEFFGRQEILRQASAAILSDENIVIQGLRRSGKTSILRELRRRLLPRNVVITLGDFQVLDNDSVDSLCLSLARNFTDELREAKKVIQALKTGSENQAEPEQMTPAQLSDRIKRVAARNPDVRFVIAVDEIESAARIARTQPEKIRTLLGGLRSAAQGYPNVSLAFSGVANRMFSSSHLGEGKDVVDNPMFGQVTPLHLADFKVEETGDLLVKLGAPMLLDWTPDAVAAVQDATGGMPYFVRGLASHVRAKLPRLDADSEFTLTTITRENVTSSLPTWREAASSDWRELIDALGLHYRDAADLLEPSLTPDELDQWIKADPKTRDAAEDLARLGLLVKSPSGTWQRSESLVAIHRLLSDRSGSAASETGPISSESGFLAAVARGESHSLEFKETLRIDTRSGEKAKYIEAEVVRAICGFMNADGGTLLVGVRDNGEIKGLARDLQVFKNDLDGLERWILGNLLGEAIGHTQTAANVRIHWVTVRGVQVCALEATPAADPVWCRGESLYVRVGNQTRELKGPQITDFVKQRAH